VGRRPRSQEEGIYHLAAHGSDTRAVFLDDEDRRTFLARVATVGERFGLGLVSYTLMSTHYHALLRVPDDALSKALRLLHTEYARFHNRRHARSAHLFRAHPYVGEIASSEQLVSAARYLARNPVEAGLARTPFEWPWSSAAAHAGLTRPALPLAETELEVAFGGARWRDRYTDYVGT
jgi:putative transposase